MKLAKKMLVSVLALAMVAALALTAFAAAPTLNVVASDAVVGKEMTVTVSATNMVNTQTGTLSFEFDPEVLEFVGVESTDDGFAGEGGMKIGSDNVVSYGFMYMSGAKKDTTFCTITFKVLKAADTEITATVDSWTGTDAPAGSVVTINATEPTTAAPTTAAPTTEAPSEAPVAPTTGTVIPQTGEVGIAAIAGVMALAAVAFVVTRKKDEE